MTNSVERSDQPDAHLLAEKRAEERGINVGLIAGKISTKSSAVLLNDTYLVFPNVLREYPNSTRACFIVSVASITSRRRS